MKSSLLLTLAAIAFLSTGCASVVSGTDQKLTFNSEPEEATVTVFRPCAR